MKNVFGFIAVSMLLPAAALAQVPPSPPTPPPAVVAPTPPVPPQAIVVAPPVIERQAIEDMVRMSRDVARQVDSQAIREQAREAADRARAAADEARRQNFEWHEFTMPSMNFDLHNNFDFDFQDRYVFNVNTNTEDGLYNAGMSALTSRRYDQAITRFDQCVARKGAHADGALYWKAYSQYRLGQGSEASVTLAELRKSYAQSPYLEDARILDADVKKNAAPDANDDDLKLLAIAALQNSDPARAIPLLQNVLKAANSLQIKKKALFVLAQNDSAQAHQILLSYAKGAGNPDLQAEAIRYLVARKGQTTTSELMDIYKGTHDDNVRRAVLDALLSTGDRVSVLTLASSSSNSPVAIRRQAISGLGNSSLATPQDLMSLYAQETDKELRMTIVRALSNMGAVDQVSQIIKTEKDPAVRQQAIRSLGNMKVDRTGQSLVDLYGTEQDKDVRKTIISSLANQNNADALVGIAKKETDKELKVEIVKKLVDLAPKSKTAQDYLVEFIK